MPLETLLFAGDIMLNGITPSPKVFAEIQRQVGIADLAFANLEIPLTASRTPTRRKTPEELRRRDQFILKADPGHAKHLVNAGIDLFSTANNHAMDYGFAGATEMLTRLRKRGVDLAGVGENGPSARACAVRELPDGTRVGLISAMCFKSEGALWKTTPATDQSPGVAVFSFGGVINDRARKEIRSRVAWAKRTCDVLVVAVHWGIERKTVPDGYQVALGRALVDAGADVVWGHHPHVLQGAELYRGKPILYSMGNLISPLPAETGLITLKLEDRKATRFSFSPCRIGGGKVTYIKGRAAMQARDRFASLCEEVNRKYPHSLSRPLFARN